MKTLTQQIILREEKKHSVRYDAIQKEGKPVVTGIYISKAHLATPYPKSFTVTFVEDANDGS